MTNFVIKPNEEFTIFKPENLEEQVKIETEKRKILTKYIRDNLKEGVDFYTIQFQGRESKPSLSKAGSEKFISLLHLRAEFSKDDSTWEMLGRPAGVICYLCKLYTKHDRLMGEGRGARDVKKDNGDTNKAIKMAEKSALIDAVLRTAGLSEAYTQDLEDMKETKEDFDPVLDQLKKTIFWHLVQIHKMRNFSEEQAKHWVKQYTDLDLIPEHYEEIASRLSVVSQETKEIHKSIKNDAKNNRPQTNI